MTEPDPRPSSAPSSSTNTTGPLASRAAGRAARRCAGEPLDALLAEHLPGSELNTLLSDRRERCVTSAIGTELLAKLSDGDSRDDAP